ncbi:MAG: hypothetical protein AB1449_00315 [Chloroflexota bacterium]
MRVIERSEFLQEDGQTTLENRIRATLRYGFGWYASMEAQRMVGQRLGSVLGPDYVLMCNVALPGSPAIVPLILIGPQGVRSIVTTSLRGTYRAKGEEWLTFDSGARHFKRVRPNQQAIAIGHSDIVLKYFRGQGYDLHEVEPVLIFTNPRTHVDTARPRVRIVMADGIEHFGANLLQLHPILDHEDVEALVDCVLHPKQMRPEPTGEPFVPAMPPAPTPAEPVAPVRPSAFPERAPEPSEVVESLRPLWAEPEITVGPEAEEVILEAPFQPADILPTLQKGIKEGVPRIQQGVQRLDQGVERLDQTLSTRGARLARRLPPFSTGQWLLLGVMVFFELVVLAIMTVLVLRDVLYG